MKKILSLLLCCAMLLPLAGCAPHSDTVSGKFYYRREVTEFGTADGIITFEDRQIPDPMTDTDALLSAYFAGPEDDRLILPFPRASAVLDWELDGQTIILTMNESFGDLTDVELTIACTCICKTLIGLLPVTHVQIQLQDGLLGGKKQLLFSESDVSLYDNGVDRSLAEYTVYFTDSLRRYLIAEEIHVNLATEDDVVAFLIHALMSPPENSGVYSALPRRTELLDYSVENGICTINFSPEFEWNAWTGCEAQRLSLMSVVNTLTQLEDIHQVEFAVGGNLLVSYRNMTISQPFVHDENVIGPVRTGMNEFDATLYVSNGTEDALFPVPTRLRQTSGITQAELVVQAILDYEQRNSLYTLIPEGTLLNSVTIHSGTCYVDLSKEFLAAEGHLRRSVRSIVASVCSLPGVSSAQITVDGKTPDGDYGELFDVLSPKPFWFL